MGKLLEGLACVADSSCCTADLPLASPGPCWVCRGSSSSTRGCEQLGVASWEIDPLDGPGLGREEPYRHDPDLVHCDSCREEGSPCSVGIEVRSFHVRVHLGVGNRHVQRLDLDCSYRYEQIVRTPDEGVQVDCPEQEDHGLQKLVACDAEKHINMRLWEREGKL